MLVGVDIGTTNIKAVAAGDRNEVLAVATRSNEVLAPQPDRSEQEPEAVFRKVLEVIREVCGAVHTHHPAETVQGIVFSSAMHGLAATDASGKPLTNFWLWSDLRADDIARELSQSPEGREIYHRTGVPVHAMSPLPKLLWMKQQMPEVFKAAHQFPGIKEYVWQRLTGRFESDISVASATGLFDLQQNNWCEPALQLAGLSAERLPQLVPTSHIGYLSSADLPGDIVPASTPLIIGAGDGAFANIGSGAVYPGQFAVTIGTSAAIRTMVGDPVTDQQMRTFCYRVDASRCIAGGASNNGANVLEWLRSSVFRSPPGAGDFAGQAALAPPGSDGLLFLPYLLGERAPLYDARVRGSFHGLQMRHEQAHFVRAVMEGVLFNLKLIAEALEEQHPIRSLHAGGGFSHNRLWVQMLADIFQKPVYLKDETIDASVSGALQLGRSVLNLGQFAGHQQGRVVEPDAKCREVYEEAFQRFRRML